MNNQQMQTEKENDTTFTHSIKIEETAKGIRVHVHVYGNDQQETIISAPSTYEKTLAKFKESGHVMAVINGGA
jgi:3,4-dihydroxy-2-butanone 4-phosphate synthase